MTHEIQEISKYRKKLASAYRAIYAVAILSIFTSIISFVASTQAPSFFILGISFLIFGLLYLVLGFYVQRKSKIALAIAMGFMLLNLLAGIYNLIQTGKPISLLIPIVFFSQTTEGFKAIEALKSKL